jgi:hypothetical protein
MEHKIISALSFLKIFVIKKYKVIKSSDIIQDINKDIELMSLILILGNSTSFF